MPPDGRVLSGDAHCRDLLLHAFDHVGIWAWFNLLRFYPCAIDTLFMCALFTCSSVVSAGRESFVALVASVVWYRLRAKSVPWIAVGVFVFLGSTLLLVSYLISLSKMRQPDLRVSGTVCTPHMLALGTLSSPAMEDDLGPMGFQALAASPSDALSDFLVH